MEEPEKYNVDNTMEDKNLEEIFTNSSNDKIKLKSDWNTILEIINDIKRMLYKKRELYGTDNLYTFGLIGIYIRLLDKISRIRVNLKDVLFQDELSDEDIDKIINVLEDAFKDIVGYSVSSIELLRQVKNNSQLTDNKFKLLKEIVNGRDGIFNK